MRAHVAPPPLRGLAVARLPTLVLLLLVALAAAAPLACHAAGASVVLANWDAVTSRVGGDGTVPGAVFNQYGEGDGGVLKQGSRLYAQRVGVSGSPFVKVVAGQYNVGGGWNSANYEENYIEVQVSTLGYQSIAFKLAQGGDNSPPQFVLKGSPDATWAAPTLLRDKFQPYSGQWNWVEGKAPETFANQSKVTFRMVQATAGASNAILYLTGIQVVGIKIADCASTETSMGGQCQACTAAGCATCQTGDVTACAACKAGYTLTNSQCTLTSCSSAALPTAPTGSAWPVGAACDNVAIGGNCTAPCNGGLTGTPSEATCQADGSWALTPGSCAAVCAPGTGGQACTACSLGSFSPGGTGINCTACRAGRTTLVPGATDCGSTSSFTVCLPGYGGPFCGRCGPLSYSPGGDATTKRPECSPCPTGYAIIWNAGGPPGSPPLRTDASQCTECAQGYGSSAGGPCEQCPVGTWSRSTPSGKRYICQACSRGFTTLTTGATSSSACAVCKPGHGGPTCQRCGRGTFSPGGTAGNPACQACPGGTTTNSNQLLTSEAQCTHCQAGYGLPAGGTDCVICPVGTWGRGFNTTTARIPCIQCQRGFTTAAAGSSNRDQCSVRV